MNGYCLFVITALVVAYCALGLVQVWYGMSVTAVLIAAFSLLGGADPLSFIYLMIALPMVGQHWEQITRYLSNRHTRAPGSAPRQEHIPSSSCACSFCWTEGHK